MQSMPNVKMNGKASNAKYVTAEEGGTQVVVTGTPRPVTRRRSFLPILDGWTRLELCLVLMCTFLAVVVIALIIMLASKPTFRGDDSPDSGLPDNVGSEAGLNGHGHAPTSGSANPSKDGGTSRPSKGGCQGQQKEGHSVTPGGARVDSDVCLTPGCAKAASRILTAMDSSVNPCDNFYDFACGNWNRLNIIPEDRSSYNTFSKLGDEIQAVLKNLLEIPIQDSDIEAKRKAKRLYHSCLNETKIDIEGLEPTRKFLRELGGWPVVDGLGWRRGQKVNPVDVVANLCLYNNKILIEHLVSVDDKDSRFNIIQLDQADLGMPSADYYNISGDHSRIPVYKNYAVEVAVMFGADRSLAEKEMGEMVNFEVELAKIVIPKQLRRDNEKMYNKKTVKQLTQEFPGFDWVTYLSKVYASVNISITENEKVLVFASSYFKSFGPLFKRTKPRTIVNYLIWRIMMNRIVNLPRSKRDIKNEYMKSIYGFYREPPRWYDCVTLVNKYMGNAVGRMFVEGHFDKDSRTTALEMIHDIRDSFYDLLDEADWMDGPTRRVAKEKAETVSEKIGYEDSTFNDTALNAEYETLPVYEDRYFDNVITSLKQAANMNLKTLREPVDRNKWSTTPAVVNAFYSSTKNQIMFPAGLLQPPFYSKDYPKSLNYGGIGMVIGHELTHGFDDRGRQYDKDGILVQWWDDDVIVRFKDRAQCIIDQYSNYTMPEVGEKMNGILTQGENIADNGGIKESYRAYKKRVDAMGHPEKSLPGLLQFSNDQVFFINFAQVWCGVMRPEAAMNRIKIGVHSPGRFRVIGTLQNLDSFSKAFQCPETSYMNRKPKCSVW